MSESAPTVTTATRAQVLLEYSNRPELDILRVQVSASGFEGPEQRVEAGIANSNASVPPQARDGHSEPHVVQAGQGTQGAPLELQKRGNWRSADQVEEAEWVAIEAVAGIDVVFNRVDDQGGDLGQAQRSLCGCFWRWGRRHRKGMETTLNMSGKEIGTRYEEDDVLCFLDICVVA
ncbi:hypothetical protein PG984_016564 [Apiospora sp. TS-2023a]